jgi:hypothetical protein
MENLKRQYKKNLSFESFKISKIIKCRSRVVKIARQVGRRNPPRVGGCTVRLEEFSLQSIPIDCPCNKDRLTATRAFSVVTPTNHGGGHHPVARKQRSRVAAFQ